MHLRDTIKKEREKKQREKEKEKMNKVKEEYGKLSVRVIDQENEAKEIPWDAFVEQSIVQSNVDATTFCFAIKVRDQNSRKAVDQAYEWMTSSSSSVKS